MKCPCCGNREEWLDRGIRRTAKGLRHLWACLSCGINYAPRKTNANE